jgi:hypothetical protein
MKKTEQNQDGPKGDDSLPLLVGPDFREQAKELVAGQMELIEEILIRATVGILEGIHEKEKGRFAKCNDLIRKLETDGWPKPPANIRHP